MKTTFKKGPNLSQQTEKLFGQSVQPTIIQQSEFNKLFSFNRSIGEGTYGAVKCIQNCYGESFAIKESKDNQQTYGVFREAAIMKKFNHPNILKFIAFYQIKQSQRLIIFTEFCKFKSLKDFSPFLSSLSENQKYRLAVQIFSGLFAMHLKNIMHRDLKPDNILIDQNKQAKLCDFGFCRYDKQDEILKSIKIGTPLYNSPETQKGVYTKKCDLFSYGLIVYFIFTNGKNLFKKSQTHQQLKRQRKQFFNNNGTNPYKQINLPQDIVQLLENTITEKEEKRMDSMELKAFWHRILREKNMTGLIKKMQESEMMDTFQRFLKPDQKDSLLSSQQKLAASLIKQNGSNNKELQTSEKIILILEKFRLISGLMKQFKPIIEEVDLTKIEKQLITYGFLYQLVMKLQFLFSQCTKLYSSEKDLSSQSLIDSLESLFNDIIIKKRQLCSVIVKIGSYLQKVRHLVKPSELFEPIDKSFNELKKLQQFLKNLGAKEMIESLKKSQEIQNNQDFYHLIETRYKPQIDPQYFSKEFSNILTKYRNALGKDNKKSERQKVDVLFQKLIKM